MRAPCAVYQKEWFTDEDFPRNSAEMWKRHFADVCGDVPIVVGEIGGGYYWSDYLPNNDRAWQDFAVPWFANRSIGLFYFGLTADSDDTGARHPHNIYACELYRAYL